MKPERMVPTDFPKCEHRATWSVREREGEREIERQRMREGERERDRERLGEKEREREGVREGERKK
jgi:hypothetical protein